jgi:activator of 2-hydroxyglutaryl-CoA dehydratase
MNDKCAAGTGRFSGGDFRNAGNPIMRSALISAEAEGFVKISNMCTFFAEHEVTSRLAEGARIAETSPASHEAIAGPVVNW